MMMFVTETDVGAVETQMLIIIILACVGAFVIVLTVVGVIIGVCYRCVYIANITLRTITFIHSFINIRLIKSLTCCKPCNNKKAHKI